MVFAYLLLAAPVWAQSPSGDPFAYVSTGILGQIYSVDTSTNPAVTTKLVSTSGANYQGLVVGPNNNQVDSASHPYLVYACDANGTIVRFDPATTPTPITPETFYVAGGPIQHPQCGRITSSGDLIVTDTGTGAGWWIFTGITKIALNSAGQLTPTRLKSTPGSTDEGTALKNNGDLLIVDNANNQVFHSPAPAYTSQSTIISSGEGLSKPFGIARKSDGDIYVSNQINPSPYIVQFNADGTANASCASNVTPPNAATLAAMQMSPADTLYVAGSTTPFNALPGALFQVDATAANGCLGVPTKISTSIALPALVGVALALPNFTASQPLNPANGEIANFGYAALQAFGAPNCSLTVTATPTSPAVLSGDITTANVAAGPAVDQGWDGFETLMTPFPGSSVPPGCAANDGFFHYILFTDLSSNVTSPLTIFCPGGITPCSAGPVESVYPFGGPLPFDIGTGGRKTGCTIFMANSTATTTEPGTFCLYDAPVNNTFNTNKNTQVPAAASVFPLGESIPVKFYLAKQGASCKKGPFITDAMAVLSVLQVVDAGGNPVSIPIGFNVNGQPLVFVAGSNEYHSNWDTSMCTTPSDAVPAPCTAGTYALTTTFLSNNTSGAQSIYTVQTTLVKLQ
jgi:hypothetical protein